MGKDRIDAEGSKRFSSRECDSQSGSHSVRRRGESSVARTTSDCPAAAALFADANSVCRALDSREARQNRLGW